MAGWEGSAFGKNKGALHRMLGYSPGETIPPGLISGLATTKPGNHFRGIKVTPLMKKRAVAANNARGR